MFCVSSSLEALLLILNIQGYVGNMNDMMQRLRPYNVVYSK